MPTCLAMAQYAKCGQIVLQPFLDTLQFAITWMSQTRAVHFFVVVNLDTSPDNSYFQQSSSLALTETFSCQDASWVGERKRERKEETLRPRWTGPMEAPLDRPDGGLIRQPRWRPCWTGRNLHSCSCHRRAALILFVEGGSQDTCLQGGGGNIS